MVVRSTAGIRIAARLEEVLTRAHAGAAQQVRLRRGGVAPARLWCGVLVRPRCSCRWRRCRMWCRTCQPSAQLRSRRRCRDRTSDPAPPTQRSTAAKAPHTTARTPAARELASSQVDVGYAEQVGEQVGEAAVDEMDSRGAKEDEVATNEVVLSTLRSACAAGTTCARDGADSGEHAAAAALTEHSASTFHLSPLVLQSSARTVICRLSSVI